MYERLIPKNQMPTLEEYLSHIGKEKDLFDAIDAFLVDDLISVRVLKFDAHSRCWKMNHSANKEYICDIIPEKDAFTIVTRLSEENLKMAYDDVSQYAQKCIDKALFVIEAG